MQFERTGENEDQDLYIIDCKFDLFTMQGEKLKKLKSFKAYNILETGIVITQAFLYLKNFCLTYKQGIFKIKFKYFINVFIF